MNRSGALCKVAVGTRCLVVGLLLAALTGAAAYAQNTVLEVIPLRYRMAEEVIPIIQPMLAREGSISGFQGQLVVRTTPANLDEIKRILASIDTMPRQLLITVRQDADVDRSRSAAEVSGSVGGDQGRVTVPGSRDPRGGSVVLRDGDDSVRLQRARRKRQPERPQHAVGAGHGRARGVRARRPVDARARAAGPAERGRRAGGGAGGGNHAISRRRDRLLRPAARRGGSRHARHQPAA